MSRHAGVKCAINASRTMPSGAVFTEHCGRGGHVAGCPLTLASTDQPLTLADVTVEPYGHRRATTTCVRCSARIEIADIISDKNYDATITAHRERCFVVGDWVRVTCEGPWIEGPITELTDDYAALRPERYHDRMALYAKSGSFTFHCSDSNIRRIPRPGQVEVNPDPPTIETPWLRVDGPQSDPLDTKYDGVTLRDLLVVDEARRREQDIGPIPWRNVDPWTWTPAQRVAVSDHWSAQLRAKLAASKERERVQVVLEDDTWMANCRDAE